MQRAQVLTSPSDAPSHHRSQRCSPLVRATVHALLGSLGGLLMVACTAGTPPPTLTSPGVALTPTAVTVSASPTTPPVPASPTIDPSARTVVVRRGTIDATITLNGQVVARDEIPITPTTAMHGVRVLVGPGTTVHEGQALIESSSGDLRQHAADVRAREQAAAVRAGQALARIQDRLRQATEDADRLQRSDRSPDLVLAQSTASQARVGLQRAQTDLATLTAPPREVDVRDADQRIRAADIALQRAEADRDRVLAGATDAEIRKAQTDVAAAEITVRQAEEALQRLKGGPDSAEVQSARRQVQLAQLALQAAHRPPPQIASAQAIVIAARGRSASERRAAQALARQQIQDAYALQQLDIQRAEADLAAAVQRLQRVTQGPDSDEIDVATHEYEVRLSSLTDARERLATLQAGPSQLEIDSANAAVDDARIALEQARAQRAALTAPAPVSEVAAARSAVESARAAVTAAEARVADLAEQQRSQAQQLSDAQARVTMFQGISTGAVNSLEEASRPEPDPDIVEFAQAQTELADAREQLNALPDNPDATVLVAPADGTVRNILVGPGEDAEPARPAVTMVRRDDLVVQAALENPNSPTLTRSMPVRVRIGTASATDLTAAVDRVDQTGGTRTVQVSVNWPPTPPAVGTEAQVVVPLQRRDGVLIIPRAAIHVDGDRRFVVVVSGATTARVEVSSGLANDSDVEVVNGLQEGQRVLLGS